MFGIFCLTLHRRILRLFAFLPSYIGIYAHQRLFGASLQTTFFLYVLLGVSAASYFGEATLPSVNINLSNFTFGLDPRTSPRLLLLLLRLTSNIVVMFPALDTLSVFPLIANTLGSNLVASVGPDFVKWVARHTPTSRQILKASQASSGKLHRMTIEPNFTMEERMKITKDTTRITTIVWRLVASIPPLVGSLWATDLSFSLLLAGLAGLHVAFFAPSLLPLQSVKLDRETTVYSGWYSSTGWAYPIRRWSLLQLRLLSF